MRIDPGRCVGLHAILLGEDVPQHRRLGRLH